MKAADRAAILFLSVYMAAFVAVVFGPLGMRKIALTQFYYPVATILLLFGVGWARYRFGRFTRRVAIAIAVTILLVIICSETLLFMVFNYAT